MRVLARLLLASTANNRRHDFEGMPNIDIEASSHKLWQLWPSKPSVAHTSLLHIFRSGAVSTATRRQKMQDTPTPPICQWCGHVWPSFRHLWAECHHYSPQRLRIQTEFAIDIGWWSAQPRCTAKSGWVTFLAHCDATRRALLQVATCKLAILIMEDNDTFAQSQ